MTNTEKLLRNYRVVYAEACAEAREFKYQRDELLAALKLARQSLEYIPTSPEEVTEHRLHACDVADAVIAKIEQ